MKRFSMENQYPLSLLKLIFSKKTLTPTQGQIDTWNSFSQRTDSIADDLVVAFRKAGTLGREQFAQALEHGINTVPNPIPELKAFFDAMDKTPYWVDFEKIEIAQRAMSRVPHTILIPVMISFGLPASYIISKVNQTLIRSGDLEMKAASRLIETTAWLVYCAIPGGLNRYEKGFKTTAHVRLVHAYMRAGLNRLPDWDYEAWDRPINQTQQALTLLPFLFGTFLTIPLGSLMTWREIKAVFHFWRYLSHLMGIHPEMQIDSITSFCKMLWLTFTQEVETDEFTPRLTQAMLNAIPEIYGLDQTSLFSTQKKFLEKKYHHQLGRLIIGKYLADEMKLDSLNPILLSVFGVAAYHFAIDIPLRLIPNLGEKKYKKRRENTLSFLDEAFKRLKANAEFTRENAKVSSERTQKQPKIVA